MEKECKHPLHAREQYPNGISLCLDCKRVFCRRFPSSEEEGKVIRLIEKKYGIGEYDTFLNRHKEDIMSWLIALGVMLAIPVLIWVVLKYFAIAMLVLVGSAILLVGYAVKLMVQYTIFGDK